MNRKELLLFDMDGTLTESGENIDPEMMKILSHLHHDYILGIVSGGTYSKICQQIHDAQMFTFLFSECGNVFHKNNQLISYNNIRLHPLFPKINQLIKYSLHLLSLMHYPLYGHFIDLRTGLIYVSLIGMSATREERERFIELDKKERIRDFFLVSLKNRAMELNVPENSIEIMEGGRVGICLFPTEFGKEQIMGFIDTDKYPSIHYFGDKYLVGGNDYMIMTHPKIIPHPVDSVQQTKQLLKKFTAK